MSVNFLEVLNCFRLWKFKDPWMDGSQNVLGSRRVVRKLGNYKLHNDLPVFKRSVQTLTTSVWVVRFVKESRKTVNVRLSLTQVTL